LESRELGFTTTGYQVENQQLWLGTKRYITTSSAKKARRIGLTTTGIRVEAKIDSCGGMKGI
jgi:hypothetical protein